MKARLLLNLALQLLRHRQCVLQVVAHASRLRLVYMQRVHWHDDAKDTLRERQKAFKYMKSCGVEPILIRVSSAEAVKFGTELGVEKFQGFYIDNALRKKAA